MFLSKKLLFDRWQPKIKEYYWAVANTSAAATPNTQVAFAGAKRIIYSAWDANRFKTTVTTVDLEPSTPTMSVQTGNLYFYSGPDTTSSNIVYYGWGTQSVATGLYVYTGNINTSTEQVSITQEYFSNYGVNGSESAIKLGNDVIWVNGYSTNTSSGRTYPRYDYCNGTVLSSVTSTTNSTIGVLGKTSADNVRVFYNGSLCNVTRTSVTAIGSIQAARILGAGMYVSSNSYTATVTYKLQRVNENGVLWETEMFAGEQNNEPVYGILLGLYKDKLYCVIGPHTDTSTTQQLELIEVDSANGNILHRCPLPTPRVTANGLSLYTMIYNMRGDDLRRYVSLNGYFAVPLTDAINANGYIVDSTGYHNWFLIKVPD